jgi:hypothetical protein
MRGLIVTNQRGCVKEFMVPVGEAVPTYVNGESSNCHQPL